jgi:ATP-dependent helicase/DNAse subunit B
VTENRLNQMVGVLKDKEGLDVDSRNIGNYVKLVLADVFEEELDTIIGNGFDTKNFSGAASKKILKFFLNYEVK